MYQFRDHLDTGTILKVSYSTGIDQKNQMISNPRLGKGLYVEPALYKSVSSSGPSLRVQAPPCSWHSAIDSSQRAPPPVISYIQMFYKASLQLFSYGISHPHSLDKTEAHLLR